MEFTFSKTFLTYSVKKNPSSWGLITEGSGMEKEDIECMGTREEISNPQHNPSVSNCI